ncbi:hypothetical protein E2C01_077658 [Portunus trituberculatus]|uniref:Uncharacterized protein n=1 Tax=Portunus trituberculatus TaxID=210409 RepID=A0A5B7ILX0_PORTR|nr:hypothetical protein [Portunus trituberculatus]
MTKGKQERKTRTTITVGGRIQVMNKEENKNHMTYTSIQHAITVIVSSSSSSSSSSSTSSSS